MIVGCDPGISGALAFMDDEGRLVGVEDMPVLDDGTKGRRTVNAVLLAAIPVTMLAVPSWRRAVGLPPGATKDQARGEAIRRWPEHGELFAWKRDDGRAEACLIAVAGLKRAQKL